MTNPVDTPARVEGKTKRVLIVEDEKLLGWSISKVLCGAGYDTSVIRTEREALDALVMTPFDLIITDLKYPLIDGLKIACAAKQHRRGLPVILLGESASEDDGRGDKVDAYLEKPFDINDLKELVLRLVH